VLCVDDEPHVLDGLRGILRRSFDVRVAQSGADGLELLAAEPDLFALVISDMRMPVMPGWVFLREARRVAPDTVRMLLTGHADVDAALRSVNDGQVFRFLTKPCDAEELVRTCGAALAQHRLQAAERVQIETTLRGSVQALGDVLALASPVAFGHAMRVQRAVSRLMREVGLSDAWEVEIAAVLSHLGAVTLSEATAHKLYAGRPLDEAEEAVVARLPQATRRILGHIPRLQAVSQILAGCGRRFDSIERDGILPLGARVLRIVLDHERLAAEGMAEGAALQALRGRVGHYDPVLLDAFGRTLGREGAPRMRETS
jgi:response regulator RpfG family c-di-GMP phosphodiesterase